MSRSNMTRRSVLKASAMAGAGVTLPAIFAAGASAFTNAAMASTTRQQLDGAARTVVFALIGQSNMVGAAPSDGGQTYPAGTLEYAGSGLVPAFGALDHIGAKGKSDPSIGLGFALAYARANPSHTIVLVPCAWSGTGFINNKWNPGDSLYDAAVDRINRCMGENTDFVFAGFLWHQGEADGLNKKAAAAYQANLTAMVAALRGGDVRAAAADTPFVLGDLREDFNIQNVPEISAIIADAPNFLDYCGFAPSTGLTGHDDRHFDAASLRTLGDRYYSAYVRALADVPA